jgi:ribonuclease HIII
MGPKSIVNAVTKTGNSSPVENVILIPRASNHIVVAVQSELSRYDPVQWDVCSE